MRTLRLFTCGSLSLLLLTAPVVATGATEPTQADPQNQTPLPEPKTNAEPSPAPVQEPLPPAVESGDRIQLNAFWEYGPVIESSDKTFRFHFGGRFDFDNTWYHQTPTLPFQLQDGADMRRARLRADVTIGENVDFVTDVNFANIQDVTNESTTTQVGSVGLTDFYATFKQVPVLENVRVGHFQEPIGLEHLTSSNDWYYMERSPGHDAFLQPFDYVTGIMAFDSYFDDRITTGIAFTRVGKQTTSPFAFGAGDGEYAATGRLTCLPVDDDEGRKLLHLGIGYSYSGTDENNFTTANRPLVRAGAGSQEVPNIIATGNFFTSSPVQIMDSEIAAVLGRLSLSAEYQLAIGTNVYGQLSNGVFSDPRGDVTYQALYAEAGFFLNPEDYRRFDKKEGVWGRQLAGSSDMGQQSHWPWRFADHAPVQLICRYSYLNLASGQPVLTPSSGVQAGWENDITAGVDWYINPEVHFIVNYVYTHLQYVNNTAGDINGLGCRLHLDF